MKTNGISKERSRTVVEIDATGMETKALNTKLRELATGGCDSIRIINVYGQRYIGTDLNRKIDIEIVGTPGNDLGSFMDGPRITVKGNAQDGCGNTMNSGQIIIHGHAGDVLGFAARGGTIFVRDGVGSRCGIHMKEDGEQKPTIVIGGTAQDFMGEYMAGGTLIVLGLNLKKGEKHTAKYIGTGMHAGAIFMRGTVDDYQLGKEVGVAALTEEDLPILRRYVVEYSAHFDADPDLILKDAFIKLFPLYLRPYGTLYAP
jgi:glutamate synthase domain-containing protein 3